MKKILSVVLACALLVGCLFTLASCGKKLSGSYTAEVEILGQSGSTTYDFHGGKVDIITKTKLLGNINTETVEAKYEIAEVDGELDEKFPARRICRAVIYTKDGRAYESPNCEPRGEACENIGVDWLIEKFYRITAPVISRELQEKLVSLITGDINVHVRKIVDTANGN